EGLARLGCCWSSVTGIMCGIVGVPPYPGSHACILERLQAVASLALVVEWRNLLHINQFRSRPQDYAGFSRASVTIHLRCPGKATRSEEHRMRPHQVNNVIAWLRELPL